MGKRTAKTGKKEQPKTWENILEKEEKVHAKSGANLGDNKRKS